MIEKIQEFDSNFMEEEFESKVSHIFIMLLSSIMERDMDSVKHYLNNDIYNKYLNKVNEYIESKKIRLFDEMNVKSIDIVDYNINENEININVLLVSRYMDYFIDEDGNYISGTNDHRIEVNHNITLTKKKNTKELGEIRRCPSCGHSLDINATGKCSYCNQIIDMSKYDYIITNIDNI